MKDTAVQVKDIYTYLDKLAPVEMKMDFDNVGHQVGRTGQEVRRVLVSLDITDDVIDEAIALDAQLIVSHHPVIFFPAKRVTDDDLAGRKVWNLARHDISAICMHTNLDAAAGGVNDALAEALGLVETELFRVDGKLGGETPYGVGRIGVLPEPCAMADFLPKVTKALNAAGLRYHDAGVQVRRVAVLGGSGGDELALAAERGCDTYVTSDIKYNAFLDAKELGVNLIDGDHFCTENVICPKLRDGLLARFPGLDVTISKLHGQTARFFVD